MSTSVCSRRSNFSIMADIKLFEEKNLSITTTFLLLENKVFSINSRIIFYFFENSRELNIYSLIYFHYIISPLMRYFADCFYNLVRLLSVGSPCWAHVWSLDTVSSYYYTVQTVQYSIIKVLILRNIANYILLRTQVVVIL